MRTNAFASGGKAKSMLYPFKSPLKRLLVCFVFLWAVLLNVQEAYAQQVYNFSTPASLSGVRSGWPWNTTAEIYIDGISYTMISGGNGSFTNISSGGNGNSAALRKDGSGGDSFTLKRTDGKRFQFYGMWLNQSSMSGYSGTPPIYTVNMSDGSTIVKTYTENNASTTTTFNENVGVTSVSFNFKALNYYIIDDIKVGPAQVSLPTVATSAVSNVGGTFATVGGDITNDGGGTVTEHGIVWSTASNPTTGNNKLVIGSGQESFNGQVSGLTPNTTYYARAYAINSAGTAYGNQISFTTTDGSGPLALTPTLDTSFDQNGSWPGEQALYIGYNPEYGQQTAALKFSLTPVSGTVSSAKLRLFVNQVSGMNAFAKVWSSTNESWASSETSAPAVNQTLGQVNVTSANNWIEIDVTDYIKAQVTGSKVASLVVTGNTSSSPGEVYLNSVENGVNRPQLVITTATLLSSNANLSNLTISSGTLSPAFAAGTASYSATVPNAVASLNLTPTLADATATIKVNGASVSNASAHPVALAIGANMITVAVTAQDGTSKSYTVNVTRLSALTLPLHPLSFNGTNQYVAVPNRSALEFTTGTVEMWVKPDWTANTKGANPSLISMRSSTGTRYSIHMENNLQGIGIYNGGPYIVKSYTFTKGQWYHIAAVMTTSTTEFFVNGVSIGSTSNGINSGVTGRELKIGASVTGVNSEYFLGEIDEVRIWNTARTASEIFDNYGNPVSASSPGLVAYYPIEEGVTGTANAISKKVTESTSNAFHGTLYNYYSSNANLSDLALSAGTLSPSFDAHTVNYSATVSSAVTAVNITPTVDDATATVKVNGTSTASGNAHSINLSAGANTVAVAVTAQDGTLKTYTVTILKPTTTKVLAISRLDASPTNASTVSYRVAFDQPVTGVSTSNFSLTTSGSTAASIASITTANSTTYTVTVNTGTGSGEIFLNLANDTGMSLTVENLPVNSTEKYVIDKMPPAAPSAPALLASSDSGSSDSDNITNKTTLTFEGTAEPETTVKLYTGAQEVGSTVAETNGNWQLTVNLPAGSHTLTARATDALGNVSAASAALLVTVDLTAPAQPAILSFKDEYVTGGNNSFSKGDVLKLNGSAEMGATVKVTLATTSQVKETVANTGSWELDFTDLSLTDGTYAFVATAADVAGNESQASASFTLTIDRVAPAAPLIASISEDTGLSNTDAITSDRNILINGTAEANSNVTVTVGADMYAPVTAASDGKWLLDLTSVTLADGTYTATATAQDAAGNVSDPGSTFTIVVDTAVPSAPVIAAISNDTGVSPTDGITKQQQFTLTGMALARNQVSILMDGATIGTAVADASGTWSYDFTTAIAEGVHTLTARATGVSGIVSELSAAYTLNIDITAPAVLAAATAAPVVNAPFDVTFSFSEEVRGFELADLILVNATATGIVESGNSFTVTISPLTDGNVSVQLGAGAVTDLAGNLNAASTTITREFDVQLPELVLATAAAQVTNTAFTVTFNFTEPVSGFDQSDIAVVNAGVSNFTKVSDAAYTALITPLADGEVTVAVAADAALDVAGNGNIASAILSRTYDKTAPLVTLATQAANPVNTPFTVSFTFTEDVTGFEAGDITVVNGAASEFERVSNKLYTALITPVADGEVTVSVAASKAQDMATNNNKASNELKLIYDATKPMVTVATTAANPINAAFPVTFSFSEAVTDFEATDVRVVNGILSGFSKQSALVYAATVTPATDGEVKISVAADVAVDAATNGNLASNEVSILYDVAKPTVVLTTPAAEPTNTPFTVTFTFSEPVTGFVQSDVRITNATVSDFTAVSTAVYTALVTPTTDGEVFVSVAAEVAQDAATNGNEASATLARTYDATKPTVTLATTAADPINVPFTVTFSFSEAVNGFGVADITVANGTASGFTKVDEKTFTALITPAADGSVTVALPAGVATDAATNPSEASAQLDRLYDATAPAGYTVAFHTARVDVTNVAANNLNITGAEPGTTYFYTIASSNGGTPVSGTAAVATAAFSISNLDLTSLKDGNLTATFYLVDAAGNKGADATAEVIKITRDIVSVTAPAMIKIPIRTTYANVPMPGKVEVTYSTGAREQLNVTWNQGNYNGLVAGAYELTGELILAPMTTNITGKNVKVTVEVQPNKVPTALAFSATTFKPEATPADVIGTFTTTDPDDSEFTYTLVSGEGSKDNELFEIRNDKVYLKSNKGLSGIMQLSIRVRSTDPYNNTIEKSFTLSKELYAKSEDQLKIVNAFSPDGDGINDTWIIPELRFYNNVEIEVFDRSGVRLFHTTNPEEGWNGRDANGQIRKGAFFYIVQVKDINLVKKGVVTILKK